MQYNRRSWLRSPYVQYYLLPPRSFGKRHHQTLLLCSAIQLSIHLSSKERQKRVGRPWQELATRPRHTLFPFDKACEAGGVISLAFSSSSFRILCTFSLRRFSKLSALFDIAIDGLWQPTYTRGVYWRLENASIIKTSYLSLLIPTVLM